MLDPQVAEVIATVEAWALADHRSATIEELRAGVIREAELGGDPVPVERVAEHLLTVSGADLRLRAYAPAGALQDAALLWLHGGGWVVGDLESADRICRRLATASRVAVFSLDYSLAPEARFPVAVEQAYAALEALGRRSEFGPVRRLAIGGDSAGGNLAAAVALLCRDRGGPRLALQVLCEPALAAVHRSESRTLFADGYLLEADAMDFYWAQYLGSTDSGDPYAVPLRSPDLRGSAPAALFVGGCDLLRDDSRLYASRLIEAGTSVTYCEYPGLVHGVFTYFGIVDQARQALDDAARALSFAFGSGS